MAAKSDLVKPYIEALREKGITTSRVTVNLSGIGILFRYIDKVTDFIFIEINGDGFEVALFLDGSIIGTFTGSFNTGDDKSKVDTLMTEIDPFISTIKKQGKLPSIMILFKDKSHTLKEPLKQQINLPFRILNETDIKVRPSGHYEEVPYGAIGGVLESL